MNICLNYFGQPRNPETTERVFNNYIKTPYDVTYHILYTTWDIENIDSFKTIFPNAFIKQYSYPDNNIFNTILTNYALDFYSRECRTLLNYLLMLYIKSMSAKTISEYEELNNIQFDFIINLRPDLRLSHNLYTFYDQILKTINDTTIYIASEPRFNCYLEQYGQDAYPHAIFIANSYVSKKVLNELSIIEYCPVKTTNWLHPESSSFNAIHYLSLNFVILPFCAFPYPFHQLNII